MIVIFVNAIAVFINHLYSRFKKSDLNQNLHLSCRFIVNVCNLAYFIII